MLKAMTFTVGAVLILRLLTRRFGERELLWQLSDKPKEALLRCGYLVGVCGIGGLLHSLLGRILPDFGGRRAVLILSGCILTALTAAGLLMLLCRLTAGRESFMRSRKETLLLFCEAFLPGVILASVCGAEAPLTGLLHGLLCGAGSALGVGIYGGISETLRVTPIPGAGSGGRRQKAGELFLHALTACIAALIFACFAGLRFGGAV